MLKTTTSIWKSVLPVNLSLRIRTTWSPRILTETVSFLNFLATESEFKVRNNMIVCIY